MACLFICPIVEGHGEFQCVRGLIERIWYELDLEGGDIPSLEVIRPIRHPRDTLRKPEGIAAALGLASNKLAQAATADDRVMILVMIDAEDECPVQVAKDISEAASSSVEHVDVVAAIANVMYETWFVASANSLQSYLDLNGQDPPANPEKDRHGKGWIKQRIRGGKYSETVDQPRMTSEMDLETCRQHCPSFNRLCRELLSRRRAA